MWTFERCLVGVGILSPQLGAFVLEFSPAKEGVASMQLQIAGGTVVCAYAPNSS